MYHPLEVQNWASPQALRTSDKKITISVTHWNCLVEGLKYLEESRIKPKAFVVMWW